MAAVLVVAAFSGVLIVSGATPAMAATCSGTGCNNQDPIATGCSAGAYTAGFGTIWKNANHTNANIIGQVQIRYSPTCGTNWSRVVWTDGTPRDTHASVHNMVTGYHAEYDNWAGITGSTITYTDMVYARYDLACAYGRWIEGTETTTYVCA